MSQPLTFSQIVDQSFTVTKELLKTYIIGVLMLAVLSFVLQFFAVASFQLGEMAVVLQHIPLLVIVYVVGAALTIASVLVRFLVSFYSLLIAVDRTKNAKLGIEKTWRNLWKLLIGGIWIFLRSFVWIACLSIPFFALAESQPGFIAIGFTILLVGLCCGLFFFPRLSFTNIIQLQEKNSVRKSADMSFIRTQGYWSKIIGNGFLVSVCIMLVVSAFLGLVGLLVFMAASIQPIVSLPIMILVGIPVGLVVIISGVIFFCGLSLFGKVYMVELYETIKANPKPRV